MMKMFNIKKLLTVLASAVLILSVSSVAHARGYGDHDGRRDGHYSHRDFDKGKHWGHDRGKRRGFYRGHHRGHHKGYGKYRGHNKDRNPWYKFYKARHGKQQNDEPEEPVDLGVDVDVTFHDRAINPGTTFNATYKSKMTIQEVLADLTTDETKELYLQECLEMSDPIGGTFNNCADGETLNPLDSSLTLEAAGIVDDPEVYLLDAASQ